MRGGTLFNQTLWVSGAGVTYLPLAQTMAFPFPTIAQVNAGTAYAPNSAIWTVGTVRQLTAWSCIHIVINPVSGSVYVDIADATYAFMRDEVAATYAKGSVNAQYAVGKACTSATSVATLLAGTDATMAYANVNLSGTAFAISGTTCGVASCTCSGVDNPVCGGFSAWTYLGAGAIVYSLSGQAAVLLVDGCCGGWRG